LIKGRKKSLKNNKHTMRINFEKGPHFEAPIEKKEKIKPIEVLKDKVIIMGVEIPRNPEPGPRTPSAEKFKDFVIDEFSLDLLQKIAKAVYLGQPLLLEGEAAIGKSYSIEYLAYLTNNEVYRMSLNGQTDTTDLIGKWVPRSEDWRKKVEELIKHPERCKNPEARKMLESMKIQPLKEKEEIAPEKFEEQPKIGLTKEEMQRIAELEGIPISDADWIWQDGEIPRQIENGAWTILDEVNTCEPQILVRLNALLEKGGQLVLHENADRIVKPKDPNKKPMLFATCNPPGGRYRGRIPLSAEWISRWNYQNIGELPLDIAIFRAKKKAGVKVEVPEEKIKEKFVAPVPIEEELTLADVFGEEWVSDFCEKYITAFYKLREMVNKGEIGARQEQKFDYDQRDWDRFEQYIRKFREPGNMKKVIEDAVEYVILGKIKDKTEREKARDVVLKLLKVSEPKERIPTERRAQEIYLKNLKAQIIDLGIPPDHEKIIMES
jgi:MoxR-like ATPase